MSTIYYGFAYTATRDSEFVVELGDLNSLRQARWLKPRLKWLGGLLAHFVSDRIGQGNIQKPAPFAVDGPGGLVENAPASGTAHPVGQPQPFTTNPSASSNANGRSKTKGLNGTLQNYDDGSIVIEATEALSAFRTDGLDATLTALCRRHEKDRVVAVRQQHYSYRNRVLPDATLFLDLDGIPAAPAGSRH